MDAWTVLGIFESVYPDDPRPRAALDDPSPLTFTDARAAALGALNAAKIAENDRSVKEDGGSVWESAARLYAAYYAAEACAWSAWPGDTDQTERIKENAGHAQRLYASLTVEPSDHIGEAWSSMARAEAMRLQREAQ